jgi:hypothetical protein
LQALLILVAGVVFADAAKAQTQHKIDAFTELEPSHTDNAFFTETDTEADQIFAPTSGIQFAGPLYSGSKGTLTYFGRVFVNNERHNDFADLESELAALTAQLKYAVGPWAFTGRAYPKLSYSEGFDRFDIGLYDYYFIIDRSLTYGKWTLRPKMTLDRLESTSPTSELSSIAGGLDVSYSSGKQTWSLNWASAFRAYDIRVDGTERNDWRHGLFASFSWDFNPNVSAGFSLGFTRNDSSVSGLSWQKFDVTPLLSLSMKLARFPPGG